MVNKTPIEVAVEIIQENMYAPQNIKEQEQQIHNDVCSHNIKVLQSLLPIEQSHIQQESIGFAEWMQYEGYYCEQANPFYWRKSEHDEPITTTDLYQIYTQQKGK